MQSQKRESIAKGFTMLTADVFIVFRRLMPHVSCHYDLTAPDQFLRQHFLGVGYPLTTCVGIIGIAMFPAGVLLFVWGVTLLPSRRLTTPLLVLLFLMMWLRLTTLRPKTIPRTFTPTGKQGRLLRITEKGAGGQNCFLLDEGSGSCMYLPCCTGISLDSYIICVSLTFLSFCTTT
jgi:hypothetical protein